nr:RecName: Full=Fibrinogen beta chain; Contains: RecName: Full=Fibrinopeptide B; Contains: RecName: Full=Fibrinogen beta chain [Canis lupus familiaris]
HYYDDTDEEERIVSTVDARGHRPLDKKREEA